MRKIFLLFVLVFCYSHAQLYAQSIWTMKPLNVQRPGAINCLYSTYGNSILAATGSAGLHRTTDFGRSWIRTVTDSSSNLITIFQSSDSLIYCGDSVGVLFQSKDDGASWKYLDTFGSTIMSIAEQSPKNLFLATVMGRIYKSTNAGNAWSLVFDFKETIKSFCISGNASYAVVGDGAVKVSNDNCATWTSFASGLPTFLSGRIFKDKNSQLYIGLSDEQGVYKYDAGAAKWVSISTTWNLKPSSVLSLCILDSTIYAGASDGVWKYNNSQWKSFNGNLQGGMGMNINALCVDSKGFLLCGISWGLIFRTNSPVQLSENNMIFSVDPPDKKYPEWKEKLDYTIQVKDYKGTATDADVTIFCSMNNETQVMKADQGGTLMYSLTIPENTPDDIYYLTFSAKKGSAESEEITRIFEIEHNSNADHEWKVVTKPAERAINAILETKSKDLFVGLNGKGLYKSTDFGANWTSLNNGIAGTAWVTSLAENSKGKLYAATDFQGLMVSYNKGANWGTTSELTTTALQVQLDEKDNVYVMSYKSDISTNIANTNKWDKPIDSSMHRILLYIKVVNSKLAFVEIEKEGLFYTTDMYKTLIKCSGLDSVQCSSIIEVSDGLIVATQNKGLYFSSDKGQTWAPKATVPAGIQISNIFKNPINNDLYGIANNMGMIRSTDGLKWRTINDGLVLGQRFNPLTMAFTTGNIAFLSSADNVLYKRFFGSPVSVIDNAPPAEVLIYPNPVSSNVRIVLRNSSTFIDDILIFAMDGRKVRQFNVSNGLSSTDLDLSELRSGMYILQINSTSGVQRTPIIINK